MSQLSYRRMLLLHRKTSAFVIQFLPFVCTILMTAMGLFYVHTPEWSYPHIDTPIWYVILAFTMTILWLVYLLEASRSFGFCRLHRQLILFTCISVTLIYINRWFGLGIFVKPLLWTLTPIGIFLNICVIRKLILKYSKHGKHHNPVR